MRDPWLVHAEFIKLPDCPAMIDKLKNRVTILIAGGNLFILILLVAIGFVVVGSMHRLSSITAELYEHPFTVNNAAQVTKFKLEHIRDHMLEIALSKDPKKAAALSVEMSALDSSARENFKVVEANFLGDPDKLKEARRLLDEWRDAREGTIDLAMHGQWSKVESLVMIANRTIFTQLDSDVDYIVSYTRYKADAFVKEANDEAATVIRRVVWLLAGFTTVVILIGWDVSRRTRRLIHADERAAEAIRKSERSYRSLFENMLEGYVHGQVIYENGRPQDFRIIDANGSFRQVTGLETAIGKKASEIIYGIRETDSALLETLGRVALTGKPEQFDTHIQALNKWLSISAYSTEREHFVVVCNDISRRKEYEREMRIAASIFNSSSEAMVITDSRANIISVNPAFTAITGYGAEEVLGKNPLQLRSGLQDASFYKEMRRSLADANHWQGEVWDKKKTGEDYAVRVIVNSIKDGSGSEQRYSVQFSDITEKKKTEEILSKNANFDTLTGLANRRMFLNHLALEIKKARRSHNKMALMFLDLDRFKEVNDTLGHHAGDQLLVEAAKRIVSCVRETDIVSRLGGDEFTLILSEVMDVNRIENVAHAIIQSLGKPYQLAGEEVFASASMGIAIYPTDATDESELLHNADQAMYLSKSEGRNCFHFFTAAMQESTRKRQQLAQDLRIALQDNQFQLYFQPIVDLQTGEIFKAETLLRWNHPAHGMIEPAEFIPIAEEIGIIDEIGDWVFGKSLEQAKLWSVLIGHTFRIGVNISPVQLMVRGQNNEWINHVQEAKLSGKNVSIEITEKTLINDRPEVGDSLLSIHDAGIEVAIGNFGTGYSSLSCLQKFKIDYLKIDRSFTKNLTRDPAGLSLSEAIIVMAHKLGMKVIAEGIETAEQQNLLRSANCDFGQGYYFSRPVPGADFEKLLKSRIHSSGTHPVS